VENNTRAPTPGKRGTPGLNPNPIAWEEGKRADTLSPQTKRCARSLKPTAAVESGQLLSQA
jgi:hypothetical protein